MRNNTQSVNFTGTQNCMYVSTINDLRRFKPSTNGQVVLCSGSTYVGDGQGNFYSWSNTATGDDDGITIILSQYSGQNGGRWLILNKQGNIDAVVASVNNEIANRIAADNVLQNNINSETKRAELAEQQINTNKVNRDGDIMYGRLNIQNNAGLLNTSTYQHQTGAVDKTNGILMTANSAGYLDLSMKQNDKVYYGSFNVNGTEYTLGNSDSDHNLLIKSDLVPSSTGTAGNGWYMKINNILLQGFTANTGAGRTVTFPTAYASVPVVNMTIQDGLSGNPPSNNNDSIANITTSGFDYTGYDRGVICVQVIGTV